MLKNSTKVSTPKLQIMATLCGNSLLKNFLVALMALVICSCSYHYMVRNDDFSSKPDGLNASLIKGDLDGECPDLFGRYYDVPITYEYLDGKFKKIETREYTSLVLFRLYREELDSWSEGKEISPPLEPDLFYLEFDGFSNGILRINSVHAKGIMVHNHSLVIVKAGGSCRGGKLIYPVEKYAGGGDGSFSNRKIYMEVYRNAKGDIVVYEQSGLWYSSIFTPKQTHTRHKLYRYVPLR